MLQFSRVRLRDSRRAFGQSACIAVVLLLHAVAGIAMSRGFASVEVSAFEVAPKRTLSMNLVSGKEPANEFTSNGALSVSIGSRPPALTGVDKSTGKLASLSSLPVDPPKMPIAALVEFLPSESVSTPATPLTDWNIEPVDMERLAVLASVSESPWKLSFRIWVDSKGKGQRCSVEEPSDLDAQLARSLETSLCASPMLPAQREGLAVGNVRLIEFAVGS